MREEKEEEWMGEGEGRDHTKIGGWRRYSKLSEVEGKRERNGQRKNEGLNEKRDLTFYGYPRDRHKGKRSRDRDREIERYRCHFCGEYTSLSALESVVDNAVVLYPYPPGI